MILATDWQRVCLIPNNCKVHCLRNHLKFACYLVSPKKERKLFAPLFENPFVAKVNTQTAYILLNGLNGKFFFGVSFIVKCKWSGTYNPFDILNCVAVSLKVCNEPKKSDDEVKEKKKHTHRESKQARSIETTQTKYQKKTQWQR